MLVVIAIIILTAFACVKWPKLMWGFLIAWVICLFIWPVLTLGGTLLLAGMAGSALFGTPLFKHDDGKPWH